MNKQISVFPIRVYYEDTDAGGVVYHARYLHFFERARTEYLRTLDFSQQSLLQEQHIAFVVKSLSIDYCIPAKLDDYLIVETELTVVKGATIFFEQRLIREKLVLSEATVKVVCVDINKMKPIVMPEKIRMAFLNKNNFRGMK